MNFQMLVLAFAVVVATNIHCQAKPQLEDSDKSPEVRGQAMARTCICNGRRNAKEQNCPCEQQRQYRNMCLKERIAMSKKCQQVIGENRKEKKRKGISTPI